MINLARKRLAKSASGRTALTLLTTLAVLGASALAVYAANAKPDFAISASPATHTVAPGQSTSYTVTVSRSGGYSGTVVLSVSGLPRGATAAWSTSRVTPPSSTATLTVQTSSATSGGTSKLTVTGADAQNPTLSHSASVLLAVVPPDFSLSASPSNQTVLIGQSTSYTVSVQRLGGFSGPVALAVSGLPSGATATLNPNTIPASGTSSSLQLTTSGATPAGTYPLKITGTGYPGAHSATVSLDVDKPGFTIAGRLGSPLVLGGAGQALNLVITNPYNQPLTVSGIKVTVASTSTTACPASEFSVTQIPASYSLTIPRGSTRSLTQLGSAYLPRVVWLDLPFPQNSCLGAQLSFNYSAAGQR
jgi:uncharacterized membrane protein